MRKTNQHRVSTAPLACTVHRIIKGGIAALCYCLTRVVPAATTGSSAIQSAVRRRSFKGRSDVKVSLGSCRYSDLICLLSSLESLTRCRRLPLVTPPRYEKREKTTTAADNENSSFSPESVYKCLPAYLPILAFSSNR